MSEIDESEDDSAAYQTTESSPSELLAWVQNRKSNLKCLRGSGRSKVNLLKKSIQKIDINLSENRRDVKINAREESPFKSLKKSKSESQLENSACKKFSLPYIPRINKGNNLYQTPTNSSSSTSSLFDSAKHDDAYAKKKLTFSNTPSIKRGPLNLLHENRGKLPMEKVTPVISRRVELNALPVINEDSGSPETKAQSCDNFTEPVGPHTPISRKLTTHNYPSPSPQKETLNLHTPISKKLTTHTFPSPSPQKETLNLFNVNGVKYLKMRILGKGGSSIVYECVNLKEKHICAIKIVQIDPSTEIASYRQEISMLRKMSHSDRVIKVFDYEETKTELKIVLEAGSLDLQKILNSRQKNLKFEHVFNIQYYWQDMLLAVKDIHDKGIIHSDLKPANFLMVDSTLKLIDFGISACIQNDKTSIMKDNICGTFNYMSPESLNQTGDCKYKISVKSDVWSLGCILYNMVYGVPPFHHYRGTQKLLAIQNPRTVIKYPTIYSPDLLDVLKRCLTYNPSDRASIQELLDHPFSKNSFKKES